MYRVHLSYWDLCKRHTPHGMLKGGASLMLSSTILYRIKKPMMTSVAISKGYQQCGAILNTKLS